MKILQIFCLQILVIPGFLQLTDCADFSEATTLLAPNVPSFKTTTFFLPAIAITSSPTTSNPTVNTDDDILTPTISLGTPDGNSIRSPSPTPTTSSPKIEVTSTNSIGGQSQQSTTEVNMTPSSDSSTSHSQEQITTVTNVTSKVSGTTETQPQEQTTMETSVTSNFTSDTTEVSLTDLTTLIPEWDNSSESVVISVVVDEESEPEEQTTKKTLDKGQLKPKFIPPNYMNVRVVVDSPQNVYVDNKQPSKPMKKKSMKPSGSKNKSMFKLKLKGRKRKPKPRMGITSFDTKRKELRKNVTYKKLVKHLRTRKTS